MKGWFHLDLVNETILKVLIAFINVIYLIFLSMTANTDSPYPR